MITTWSEYRHALQRDRLNDGNRRVHGLTQLIPSTSDTYRTDTASEGCADPNQLQQLVADAFRGTTA